MQPKRTETQRDYEERLLRVLTHLHQNLESEVELEQLASLAHFSPFHFHRIFCGMVGEPVQSYVRRLRLERAAFRLKHGEAAVLELALDAGYESPEAFTRAFRRRFGVSPRDFRSSHRAKLARVGPDPRAAEVEDFQPRKMETTMNARTESLDSMHVAYIRHAGPYEQVGGTWQRVYGWAGPKGLLGPDVKMFGLAYDDPDVTAPENLRYEACITVPAGTNPEGEVGVREVLGGRYAVATHVGPYSGLSDTYGQLIGQWMPSQDLQPRATQPCLEFYRNDPHTTPEDQLQTDIYVPLE